MEVLRWGYRIPFRQTPTLSKQPIPYPAYSPDFIRGKALEGEVRSLLGKVAIELAPLPSLGFCSQLFVVMEASGSWRPVIDLLLLNLKSQKTSFKMETLQSVLLSVRAGDWMVSLDLKDAYLQVPMHLESRKFRGLWEDVPVQSSLLWPLHSSAGFHTGHGSCFGFSSPFRHSVMSLPRQLAHPNLLPRAGSPCSGYSSPALPFAGDSHQLGEVAADSNSAHGVSRGLAGLHLFQGFSCPQKSREASLNGEFGKLPSHQMAVVIMCLIGKKLREIHFGHRALPYILCAYKYIQCL